MKFKYSFPIMVLLMLSLNVKAENSNSCGGFLYPGFDWELVVKTISGITCFEGKDLTKDYEQVCGCVKALPKLPTQAKDNIEYFKKRAEEIMNANTITNTTSHTRDAIENERNKSKAKQFTKETAALLLTGVSGKTKTALVSMDEARINYENQKKAERLAEERKRRKMLRECGYNVDEFRRMSRIPSFNLMDADEKEVDGERLSSSVLWFEYLHKNPDLLAIDVNLPEGDRLVFRDEVMGRMKEIRNANPVSREFSQNKVDYDKNGEVLISSDKSAPDKALWYQVDQDFENKNGKLYSVVAKYKAISSPLYNELLENSRDMLDAGKNGFQPNFMYIAENPTLWNLYFKEDSKAATGCGIKQAQDKSSTLEAITCLKNVGGFCALYETSKEKPKPKDLEKVAKWNFKPLLEIEKSRNDADNEHKVQANLICKTKAPMGHVVSKDGKPVTGPWSIDDFKQHFCVDKDVKIGKTIDPSVTEKEMSVACENKDYPKLQGFYQRMIDGKEFQKMTAKMFTADEFKNLKIATMRNYLKEKSKFDLQTRSVEDNVTEAISGGNPKNAAQYLAESMAADYSYIENLRNSYAGVDSGKTTPVVPGVNKPSVLSTTQLINPVDPGAQTVSSGYIPVTATDPASVQAQQQVVSEEGKKILDAKEKIADLEDKKNELPPTSPLVNDFEKQIQDLRNQLASSEAKYQSAIDSLKKANQPIVAENDKVSGGTTGVQRNIASVPNLNNEGNVVGSNGNSQGTSSGGSASVSGAGRINNDGNSAKAGITNRALLQANNVDLTAFSGKQSKEMGLVLSTVKNESNEEVGVIADPGVYEGFKKKDMKLYDRYIREMRSMNLETLIVRSGDNILYFKLVTDKNDNFTLQEESRVISAQERKYFTKDLTNLINTNAQVTQ